MFLYLLFLRLQILEHDERVATQRRHQQYYSNKIQYKFNFETFFETLFLMFMSKYIVWST